MHGAVALLCYITAVLEVAWSEQSEEHVSRHGVSPEEFEDVLVDPERLLARGRTGSMVALGRSAAGRYLVAIYVHRGGLVIPITARPMTEAERRRFRRSR